MGNNHIDESVNLLDKLAGSNQYTLFIPELTTPISIVTIRGYERLNEPWYYEITFTSPNKSITVDSILSRRASLSFHPPSLSAIISHLSSLNKPAQHRTLYGIITEFCQLSISNDEVRYVVMLKSRLSLLGLHHYSAIYQNQSVVNVVESVLRKHGWTGIDYRLELNDDYPARELITQWEESDLAFIQRILADVGIWFRFESHEKHHCDVLVMSDYEQGYYDAGAIIYQAPSGTLDGGRYSIWDVMLQSKTVESSVKVNDYNYRQASNNMLSEINTQQKDVTTHGIDYLYGEHYRESGNIDLVESGAWYAKIRHQAKLSEQVIIIGKTNEYHLSTGQHIYIDGHPLAKTFTEGFIILSVEGQGDRANNYEARFTAIPFDVLKPYRPNSIRWPCVSGTVSARITSPDHDTYGYIDTQGRYRVKFNFDLTHWRNGEESLWVRLATPYAGETYGFHFPLIDGTEVAIAFMDGNPDRPYISHAMHDINHPNHVTTANKHRNVIRTPANNKLRMDDQRGQEHIKLATEYGKTQLNLGHLVDDKKKQRGEGFELRTDEYGAIRAGKGLYISSYKRAEKTGVNKKTLDADETITLLNTGVSVSYRQSKRSESHLAGELKGVKSFSTFVNYTASDPTNLSFTEPSMVISSPKGIATVTPDNIYQYAEQNILLTSKQDTNIAANNSMNVSAGNLYSVFAKQDIKLFSGESKIQLQAHNGDIEVIADKSLKIVSNQDKIDINANKEITIACGGAYIRIADGNIELYAPGMVKHGAQGFPFSGPKSMQPTLYSFPKQQPLPPCVKQFVLLEEGSNNPIINREYQILNKDNQVLAEGKTDADGRTEIVSTGYEEEEVVFRYKSDNELL